MLQSVESPGKISFESATNGPGLERDGTHLASTHIPVSSGYENGKRQRFAIIQEILRCSKYRPRREFPERRVEYPV